MSKYNVIIFKVPSYINALSISKFTNYRYVFIFGAFGFLKYKFKGKTKVDINFSKIKITGTMTSMCYTYVKIINLMVSSVTKGFIKFLELRGVGFKFKIKKNIIYMLLGYSHLKKVVLPLNIITELSSNRTLKYTSYNLGLLNNLIFRIKKKKTINIYKGKGIFYKGEIPTLKEGKKSTF